MYKLTSAESVHKFIQEYRKLKSLITCAICLDLANDPTQASCGHKFCNNCLEAYQSFFSENTNRGNTVCPSCKLPLEQTEKFSQQQVGILKKFLCEVKQKLQEGLGFDFSEDATFDEIQQNLNKAASSQDTISTDVIPPTVSVPIKKRGRRATTLFTSVPTEETANKSTPLKTAQLDKENFGRSSRKSRNSNSKTRENLAKSSSKRQQLLKGKDTSNSVAKTTEKLKKDAFDELMRSSNSNPLYKPKPHVRKTYGNKTKKEKIEIVFEETKVFEDDENRVKILQWLNDNNNKFERLTQTQQMGTDSPQFFNMPSVSQFNSSKDSVLRGRSRVIKNKYSVFNRRAKSLDVRFKKGESLGTVLKRHSLAGDSPTLENIDIEEIESEDDQIVQLLAGRKEAKAIVNDMEEQFLKSIEFELDPQENTTHNAHPSKEDVIAPTGDTNRQEDCIPPTIELPKIPNTTGWDRMKKSKMSITKKDKKPLKVNTSSSNQPESSKNSERSPVGENQRKDPIESALEKLIFGKEDEIFIVPTQKVVPPRIVEKSQLTQYVDQCANTFENIKRISSAPELSTSPERHFSQNHLLTLIPHVNELEQYLNKIKSMLKKDEYINKSKQVNLQVVDMDISLSIDCLEESARPDDETLKTKTISGDKSRKGNMSEMSTVTFTSLFQEKAVQTCFSQDDKSTSINFDDRDDKAVQTDTPEEPKGIYITSTDMFNTPLKQDGAAQTEPLRCPKCLHKYGEDIAKGSSQDIIFGSDTQKIDSQNQQANKDDIFSDNSHLSESLINNAETINILQKKYANKSQWLDMIKSNKTNVRKATQYSDNLEANEMNQSNIVITLPTQKKSTAFRRLVYSGEMESNKKKFKRIRTTSDSDSDSENPIKKSKNVPLVSSDSDYSIQIESGCEGEPPAKKAKDDSLTFSMEADQFNYDECLQNILNKYDENAKKTQERAKPKSTTQEIIERCNNILSGVSVLNKTDNVEKTVNHPVDPLMNDGMSKNSYDLLMKEFNSSFENEADNDKEVTNITLHMEENEATVRPDLTSHLDDFTMLPSNVVPESPSNKSEELFNTDGDEDIVETTPQKPKPILSQRTQKSMLPPPQNSPDIVYTESFIVMDAVPPPPGFEDDIETVEPTTEFENFDNPIPGPSCFQNKRKEIETSTQNQTLCSLNKFNETVDLSPIKSTKTFNAITALQNTISPLTIIKSKTSQATLNASTPKQKSILDFVRTARSETSSPSTILDNTVIQRKPCISCSRLAKDQILAISSLTNKKLATYSNTFSSAITHMIVNVNENNCVKDHTIKYVSAVAAGIWVVNFSWVQECLKKNYLVDEEPFEVVDLSGIPGPKKSRLTRTVNPLLHGFKIFAAPPFLTTTQKDVENIINLLKGCVAKSADELSEKDGRHKLIVTELRATQDFNMCEIWLETLNVVTVDIEWLSRSVGQYKLLSLRPFILCSDESLDNLGYPEDLTANLSFSFSQGV